MIVANFIIHYHLIPVFEQLFLSVVLLSFELNWNISGSIAIDKYSL